MFRKRCSLCGGKLNNKHICKECGLDNSKSDKNYRMNQSSCDGMPLTHTHEDNSYRMPEQDKPKKQHKVDGPKKSIGRVQYDFNGQRKPAKNIQYNMGESQKADSRKGCFTILFIIIIGVIALAIVGNNLMKTGTEFVLNGVIDFGEDYEYEEMDPYEHLSAALQEQGESVEYKLQTGRYIVGVHIPEGNYVADVQDEFDVVQVDDLTNQIYLYEYEAKEEGHYLNDLRLFKGAIVKIGARDTITLSSDNAQPGAMQSFSNPLTESYDIQDTEMKKAGVDFEAGVYDIEMTNGYGGADISIYDRDGMECESVNLYFSESGTEGVVYKNMVLPEGAEIILEEGLEITMTPSEVIESPDYFDTYRYY